MNGSLPPSSRLIARDALGAARGDPLAGLDRAGERDAVDALVGDDPLADVAGAREQVTTPAGRCSKHGASIRVESGVSSRGLQTTALPAASAGASFHASSSSG